MDKQQLLKYLESTNEDIIKADRMVNNVKDPVIRDINLTLKVRTLKIVNILRNVNLRVLTAQWWIQQIIMKLVKPTMKMKG